MSAKKVKIFFILLVGIFILIPSVFAFSGSEQKIDELDKKINSVIEENSKLKNDIILIKNDQTNSDLAVNKLIEGVNIKNDGIDMKSNSFDHVADLMKWFGVIVVCVAVVLGLIKGWEFVQARKEMHDELEIMRGNNEDINKINQNKIDSAIKELEVSKNNKINEIENRYKNFVLSIQKSIIKNEFEKNGYIFDDGDHYDNEEDIKF